MMRQLYCRAACLTRGLRLLACKRTLHQGWWSVSTSSPLFGNPRRRAARHRPPSAALTSCASAILTAVVVGVALWISSSAPALAADSDCMQDGGKVLCLRPSIGDWQYFSARCNATLGPFTDEDSALSFGVEQEYLRGSGCTWSVVNPGAWGTEAQRSRGPCGSSVLFPDQWCTSDTQARVECGIETDNWRQASIRYLFTPFMSNDPCSAAAVDGIGVKRHRAVACHAGMQFVRVADGSWLCQIRVDESNNGKTCCNVGNPINPATGNKYQEESDYIGAGPFPLSFQRSYNSRTAGYLDVGFGAGWTSNLHARLTFSNAGTVSSVSAMRADGKVLLFVRNGADWAPNSGVSDRLVQSVDALGAGNGWIYTAANGDQVETYDANGTLRAITNRAGLTQHLSYDGQNRLIGVTDAFGRQLIFGYAAGRIAVMRDPDPSNPQYTYSYNGGNLVGVAYPDGTSRTYHYEDPRFPQALTGITDENGSRYATWTYNSYGRAASSEHAGGVDHVGVDHGLGDSLNSAVVVTDARQVKRTYSFDHTNLVARVSRVSPACDKCGLPATTEYDSNGNRFRTTDYNFQQTEYHYDLARNLLTQRIDVSNQLTQRRYTNTEWHPVFRLPTRISEPLRRTTLVYDGHGNVLSKTLQATTDSNGSLGFGAPTAGAVRAWSYTYTYSSTIAGHVTHLVADGPRTDAADISTYDWDDAGNLLAVTNALGHVTALGNYDAHGRPQLLTDVNGLPTVLAYDARGRLISRSEGGELTHYQYDGVGQLIKMTMPDGSSVSYGYDDAHRLVELQDNFGNRISYTLDATGNRVQEQVFDPNHVLVQRRSREYNALDRLIKDIGGTKPATQVTQYSYDDQGNLISVTDPLGHVTRNVYDALNRIKQVIDPAAVGSASGGMTQYAYDGLDQLTQVSDPRGLATGYTIDGLGNVTRLSSPDTGVTSSAYDAAGNLVSQIDPRGVIATMRYDALNRLQQAVHTPPAGSNIAPVTLTYSYDVNPSNPSTPERGRLTSLTDPSGTSSYVHDIHGRVVAETRVVGGRAYLTGYSYDAAGRLTDITYPSGRKVAYGFDALGRIRQIDTTYLGVTQTAVTNVSYQPFGPVKSFAYGNARASVRTFDADGRPTSYTLGSLTRGVSYDDASRIVAFTKPNAQPDHSFVYDNLNRLSNWSAADSNQSFLYDAVGNRISHTIGANTYPYTYSAASNQLTNVGGSASNDYRYDPAGNLSSTSQASFAYDARHRMTQATLSGRGAAYQLNALGQRVMKTPTTGNATVYHYDTNGHLIAESDTQGNVQVEYIYLGNVPVAVMR